MIPVNGNGLIPLTPAFLIATASAWIGLREEGGNNRGLMIALMLREVNQPPGQPWCAAFVHHVGFWSHYDHQAKMSVWPLPRTASCYELGQAAKRKGILMEAPEPGDVFLVHDVSLGRFAHTGVVVRVEQAIARPSGSTWYDCTTIEGNTNEEGSREGNVVACKRRRFYPEVGDRFIRWVNLDRRDDAGDATGQPGIAA